MIMRNKAEKYAIVEVIEREIMSMSLYYCLDGAIKAANDLLESRTKAVNRFDEFENGDGEGDEWEKASGKSLCAWCNWRDNWDAHIIKLDDESYEGGGSL